MSMWFLYMIRLQNGSLYTGITTDVERRFREHKGGKIGAKFLRGKGELELVYQNPVGNRSLASKAEYAVKKLGKSRKEALVVGDIEMASILETLRSEGQ